MRRLLIAVALGFLALFLVLPLAAVFVQALGGVAHRRVGDGDVRNDLVVVVPVGRHLAELLAQARDQVEERVPRLRRGVEQAG